MSQNRDWRLTNQINYLENKPLKHAHFEQYSDSWDHEHCEFCFEKFSDINQTGYCTLDKYHWICEKCFEDFKEVFAWTVAE